MARSKRRDTQRRREEAEARRQAARRRRLVRNAVIGLIVAAAAGAALYALRPGPPPTGTVAQEAWDLPQLGGDGRVALADFSGKPTVAAFFASWCPHCRRELPGFAALSGEVGDQVNFVGINTQDNGRGLSMARDAGIDGWPLARDVGAGDQRDLSTTFGARGMPLTVIYAPDGSVADVTRGPMSATTLLDKLETLFGVSA